MKWQYDIADIWGDNIGGFCKLVAVGLSADLCGKSDDSKHHGYIIGPAVTLFGETKYPAKCNLCGQGFSVTDAQISDAYTEAVNQMPATGYDSAGKLLWQPRWIEDTSTWGLYFSGCVSSTYDGYYQSNNKLSVSYLGSEFRFTVLANVGYNCSYRLNASDNWHSFRAPISGTYTILSSQFAFGNLLFSSRAATVDKKWKSTSLGGIRADSPVSVRGAWTASSSGGSDGIDYALDGTLSLYTPVFEIVPFTTDTTINNTYNINTRVNNFQGNYYNNVTNNYYNNTTIINETTNNYYDMTTNNYYTMSNWSYDYQSRTYFITLEDGTTITVQFGDNCLTITNNNVENSYQYVINNNNTPSPNPETPSTCKHNWTETIDVAPTCLEGGHANFTCSLCGETYEQILSAKGHNWTVKEHVNTVYGENGVIVTQGHTLYECSICGEQWYTETATPPPDVSGGSSIRSWLQAFQLWLDGKLDSLFSAADAVIVTKLDALIEKTSDTVVNVIGDNTYVPGVLYLDDDNGVVNTTKNGVSIFGDLLRWLWQNVFDGAFEAADITKLDGLFYDPTEVTTDGNSPVYVPALRALRLYLHAGGPASLCGV